MTALKHRVPQDDLTQLQLGLELGHAR